MKITPNIHSMDAIRLVNINIESYAESTGKISSGYKINSAADYPAGLGISEIMRRQIRGLMQATNNTKDGVAFVQSADGAMDEIHAMLQRMNELTDKALNGTWSDSDRMAMNVEFDQLRTEMDRINKTTEFGTGIPVFEQHKPSYYQISGNRKWDDNQLHTISPMANALNIHLPDGYEPKDYTITVPAGVYTTQELIDEIDNALSSMVPPNPGFVFELTSDGYCNLSFEKDDGTPTKIDYVDGSLAYLLYDFKSGAGSNDILGTTLFLDDEKLVIVNGKNDELGLYLEGVPGIPEITLRIPAGAYTRKEMIDTINAEIKVALKGKDYGIFAAIYGDHCIQISSGSDASVVGLHGNMFKYEETSPVYTSVFYDNVKYGSCGKKPATITSKTNELPIHFSTDNNILKFRINDETKYTEVKLNLRDYATIGDLAEELKDKLAGKDVEVKVIDNCLSLSTTKNGELSSLEFDISEPYGDTYKTIFFGTSELPKKEPFLAASIAGVPDLSGGVDLNAEDRITLLITEGTTTQPYDFIFSKTDTYTLDDLVNELKSQLAAKGLENKIEISKSDSNIIISGTPESNVKEITLVDLLSDTEDKLLIGEIIELNGSFTAQPGKKETVQGTTTIKLPSVTVKSSPCSNPNSIKVDENSNTITFDISCTNTSKIPPRTITIDPGSEPYDLLTLAQEINKQLQNSDDQYLQCISAEMYGDCLQFIFKPTELMSDGSWEIDISFDKREDADNNSIWKNFFENESKKGVYGNPLKPATLTTMVIPMGKGIEINEKNNTLELSINGGSRVPLTINNGTYSSLYNLASAIQTAINGSDLKGKVSVEAIGGSLKFTSEHGSLEANGNFYDNVMCKGMYDIGNPLIKGICNYDPAFIIGRQDLTQKNIEIISGSNDEFTFDFNYSKLSKPIPITVKISEGIYNGKTLANELKKLINSELKNIKLEDLKLDDRKLEELRLAGFKLSDFEVDVTIGGHDEIELPNTDNSTVLQITLNRAPDTEPADAQYFIDGIRGSAANTVFYKSTTTPTMSYIAGTKNIWKGVSFEPGKNVLTLSADSVPYKYTFDKNYYTADEFIDALNSMFEKGDDNGNPAPLKASIDKSGALKISYTVSGAHTITDIGGSGRSAIFFEEEGRGSRDPLLIQVGAEAKQTTEIPRISVSSTALNINSITISKQKYAEKANIRIKEAINLLSSKRSIYGAMQNRLEHTINNNDIVVDRMQASESRIRDTDLSSEMIRYSSLNILLQAGEKMIAQSNENIKKLLNLL